MNDENEKDTTDSSGIELRKKLPYRSPEIEVFGRVRELTTGGSDFMTENMGMDNMGFP